MFEGMMLHDEMRRSEDRDGSSEVDIQGCWAEEEQAPEQVQRNYQGEHKHESEDEVEDEDEDEDEDEGEGEGMMNESVARISKVEFTTSTSIQ
jgi:hypothetical protein